MGLQVLAALGQRLRVGCCGGGCAGAFPSNQAVLHFHVHCAYNIKAVPQDQVVDSCHRAGGGVLHRQHAEVGRAGGHVLKDLLESGLKAGGNLPEKAAGSLVGKSSHHPLAHHPGALCVEGSGGGVLQFPESAAVLQDLVLLGPADGHDGAV